MADLALIARGTGFVAGTVEAASPATAVLPDDLALGDYVLLVGSVDYNGTTNPQTPSCPVVASWTVLGAQADPTSGTTIMSIRAWLGRVTTAPTDDTSRTVTVVQNPASSGLGILVRGYYGGSSDATIALDGAVAGIADRSTPFTHTTITPTGTLDLLVIVHAGIRFNGSPAYPEYLAVSGMESWMSGASDFKRMQLCTQALTAAAATGTRDQAMSTATNTNALAGGAGLRFLLRSQGTAPAAGSDASTRFMFAA